MFTENRMRSRLFSYQSSIFAAAFLLSVNATAAVDGAIKAIKVRGNKRVSEAAILSAMRLKPGQILSLEALDYDVIRIREMGWFSYVRPQPNLLSDNTWEVTIDVKEYGLVREVAVTNNTAIDSAEILKVVNFVPKPGTPESELRPFNQNDIPTVVSAIQKLYTDRRLFGQVAGIGPKEEGSTTYEIRILEKRIGNVIVEGLTNTKKRVFDQLIKSKPGQIFNADTVRADTSRVYSTQWFTGDSQPSVSETADGNIDLIWKVTDGRTGMFNAGVVLDPQNSFAGSVSYSEQNLWGTGQSIAFNYTQATLGLGGSISADYTNPFIDRKDTTLRVSLYDRVIFRFANNIGLGNNQSPINDQYAERRTGGSIATTRPVSLKKSVGFSARFERVGVPNFNLQNVNFIQQSGEVGAIGLTSIYNNRDIDIDPARGRFLRLDVEPGYTTIESLGTNSGTPNGRFGFFRYAFDFRTYSTPVKRERKVIDVARPVHAFRLRGGSVQGTIPFFEQFFAGGNDSIRGYFEQRFWGNNMIVATYEYRRPIQDQFSLVTFVDYGSAWGGYGSLNDFTQTSGALFRLGYGLGIRLRTPIGPVRLDYALNGEGGSRPHFMIGTNF